MPREGECDAAGRPFREGDVVPAARRYGRDTCRDFIGPPSARLVVQGA